MFSIFNLFFWPDFFKKIKKSVYSSIGLVLLIINPKNNNVIAFGLIWFNKSSDFLYLQITKDYYSQLK